MKAGLMAAWAASVALTTWRTFHTQQRGPLPSELVATMVVFGALSVLPERASTVAALAGWGIDLAALVNLAPGLTPGTIAQPTQQGSAPTSSAPAPVGHGKGTLS